MEERSRRTARFAVLLEPGAPWASQPAGLVRELRRRGHSVRTIDARAAFDAGDDSWIRDCDLVVPRGSSVELLCLVRRAEGEGRPVLHASESLLALRNVPRMRSRLRAVGVPIAVETLPARTDRRRAGGRVRGEFRVFAIGESVLVPGGGTRTCSRTRRARAATVELTRRCVRTLDIRLIGTRWLLRGRPVLVEVDAFPDFAGVEGVSALLAAEVERALDEPRRR